MATFRRLPTAFRPALLAVLAGIALISGCGKKNGAGIPPPPPPPQPTLLCVAVPEKDARPVQLTSDKMVVNLSPVGSSVESIVLPEFHAYHGDPKPYALLSTPPVAPGSAPLPSSWAAWELKVDGERAVLTNRHWAVLEADARHAVYQASILDANRNPLVDIRRTWSLADGRDYGLELKQEIVNRSGRDLKLAFETLAQEDIAHDPSSYLGDARKFALGYQDARKGRIRTDGGFVDRRTAIADYAPAEYLRKADNQSLWPHADIESAGERAALGGQPPRTRLAWLGNYNRYFLVATHADLPASGAAAPLEDGFPQVRNMVGPRLAYPGEMAQDAQAVYTLLGTGERPLAVGATLSLPLSVYAGPRDQKVLGQGAYQALGLDQTVRYRLTEGFCGICTFQWLAHVLKWGLEAFHFVARDWAASIIILVLVIRLLLHPISKRSQIALQRYSKSIAALAPEVDKIKKKVSDSMEQQRAIQALYREKGVSHTGLLGCLPMFLQMPIWFALGALLYYFFPLREEGGAFWGVFQHLTGGRWEFLADLTATDRFIPIFAADGQHVWTMPFIHLRFDYSALNVLPLLMGVAMYFTTKYSATPTANPDQQMQQTMMRWMSVLLTPVMLYSAPAGFTLYSAASMAAGVVDGWIVRREVKRMEEAGTLVQPKADKPAAKPSDMPKPGTWKWKIMRRVAYYQAVQQAKSEGKTPPTREQFDEALKMARNFNPNPRGPQAGWQFKK